MSRLRSNCSEIWLTPNELVECHRRQRRNLPELTLQRRGDQRGDHIGARAGQLRRHLHGREVDLRQRRNRQRPIAERAADQQRDPEQRGRDRPANERFRDAHGCALTLVKSGIRRRWFGSWLRLRSAARLLASLCGSAFGLTALPCPFLPRCSPLPSLPWPSLPCGPGCPSCAARDRPSASDRPCRR